MTFEHFEAFSGPELPAPDRMIGGAGQQYLAGPVDRRARDGALVSLERPQRLARLRRPRGRREVGGTGHQHVLVLRVIRSPARPGSPSHPLTSTSWFSESSAHQLVLVLRVIRSPARPGCSPSLPRRRRRPAPE